MIVEHKMHGIDCDNCNDRFVDCNGFMCWQDPSDSQENAGDSDWHIDDDNGIHYCPNCFDFNDEDELVIDENRKNKYPKEV